MTGEIRGINAGLTRFELTLFLFLGLRAALESFLPLTMEKAGLVGVEAESSIGLGLLDMLAPGVLKAPSFGVFRADIRGVSISTMPVFDNPGWPREASGSVRSSNRGGPSQSPSKLGEG